jgi:hypothetical protein
MPDRPSPSASAVLLQALRVRDPRRLQQAAAAPDPAVRAAALLAAEVLDGWFFPGDCAGIQG